MKASSRSSLIPQNNHHFSHTLVTDASPEVIWKIWTDVSNWKQWDSGLKDAEMKGDFLIGNKGRITSLENRKSTFEITALEPGKSYTFKTQLPLSALYVKRFLKTTDQQTVFTHEVWFQGLTSGVFAALFGTKFKKLLPQVMEEIKKIAEEKTID